jgi:hypothetical protein
MPLNVLKVKSSAHGSRNSIAARACRLTAMLSYLSNRNSEPSNYVDLQM